MAKKKCNIFGQTVVYEKKFNGTSIGRRPKTSSMNKNKRRSFKKYRGQGKWIRDQAFILIETHFVDSIVPEESKILMFVINGENDTSRDK